MPSQPPRPGKFKTWITRFASTQKPKHREGEDKDEPPHTVFGAPLKVSLRYASVQISTANEEGELFVWGFVPIVVGKCGLYLKENSAEPGTFRTEGSSERISELQGLFEAPPSYGISIDWKQESYTTHDIACVLRAYLTQLPESVIPHAESEAAREALVKQPFNQDEVIRTYKRLIRAMPPVNQYLLLYVLDLLSVFARKSDKNQMTATDLAAMFHPGLISSAHKISPAERDSSQRVLEFLIAHQDWFMLDIAPPPAHHGGIELWVSAPAFWDLSTPTKVEQRAEGDSSVDWSSQEGNLSVTQRRPLPSAPRAAAPGTTVSPPTQATAALLSTKGVPQDSGERPSRLQEGPSRPPVLLTRKPPPPERSTNGLEGRQNGALDAPSTINTKITAAKEAGELSGGPHVQHKPLKRSSDPLQHSVRRPSVQDTKDIPEYTENLGINVPLTVKPEISAPRKTDQQQDPHRSSLSPTPIHDSHAKSSEDNTARQQGQLSIKDVHAEDEVQSKEDRMAERWAGTSKLAHKSSDSIAASHQDDVVSSPAESEINVLARSSGASALSSSQLEASSDSIASARPPPSAASHQDDVIPTPAASEIDVLARSSEASALSSSQLEAQVMWEDDALRHINGVLASWERRRPLLSMITAPDADRRGLSSSQLRENLGEVEAQINTLLTLILNSRGAARAAEQLEGNDAQSFIDAIQDVLDRGTLPDASSRSKARRLLQKVSEAGDQLPSSLFITDVNDHDEHPTFGGGFGDVYRASYQGQMVALKRIRIFTADSTTHRNRLQFCKEALVWQGLHHRFILPLLGIDRATFAPSFCMVSPWMKYGTVLKYLRDRGRGDVNRLLLEIAQGLDYLHSMNVIHGDLRGTNILISDNENACLADFGLATTISDPDSTVGMLTSSSNHGGSVRWFAPELIEPASFGCQKFVRTKASDVYAYACVCLEALTSTPIDICLLINQLYAGGPPFAHLSDVAAMLRVIAGDRPERPAIMSTTLWQLVSAGWVGDFRARPSIHDIAVALEGITAVPPAPSN